MLSMQYSHRLPADYDMALIRQRAAARGPLWNDLPGLAFKAFAMRERGRHGANGNVYASIYLWRDAASAAEFVLGDRFRSVVEGFGRPAVETWLPMDARAARAGTAVQVLYREDLPIGEGADLAALRAAEIRHNDMLLAQSDTLAVVSSVDVQRWRLLRLVLSSEPAETTRTGTGTAYEVLHLATPELTCLA